MLSHESLQTELDSTHSYHHSPSKPRSRLFRRLRKDGKHLVDILKAKSVSRHFYELKFHVFFACVAILRFMISMTKPDLTPHCTVGS